MSPSQIAAYMGPALAFAALLTLVCFALTRALSAQPFAKAPFLTLFLVAFFLALTQHPFPDPATLDCSTGGVAPILRPFAFLDRFARLWEHGTPPMGWIGDKVVQATGMNFLLCAAFGAARMRHAKDRHPIRASFFFGLGISAFAEITQFTAIYGLYPCPYRTFETDDLILNVAGTVFGALAVLVWRRRRSPEPGARPAA